MGRIRIHRTALLFILVLALAVPVAASRTRLGSVTRDYRNGFMVPVPDEWSAVPPRIDESVEVASWYGPVRGEIAPTLTIVRIPRTLPRKAGEALDVPDELRPGHDPDAPFSVKEWLDRKLEPYLNLARIEERKEIRIGREKGVLYRATCRESTGRGSALVQYFVAVVRTDRVEYGIVFSSEEEEYESEHKHAFMGILRSFRALRIQDEKDIDYEEAFEAAKGGGRDDAAQAAWLARAKEKIEASRDWGQVSTLHYLVLYDKAVKPEVVKRVAVQIEAIRKDVYEPMFPPIERIRAISIVRVCRDEEQYIAYGGPRGSAGYWHSGDKELVFFADTPDAIRVLYHEAFHQYIHYAFGSLDPHIWFNEGHGDYFSGFEFRGRFVPAKYEGRRQTIRDALQSGTTVPLRKFIRYSQGEYYANAGLCYAQGWALVYFLRHSPNPEYRKILPAYFDALKMELATDRVDRPAALHKALEAAFREVDMDTLQKDWAAFGY